MILGIYCHINLCKYYHQLYTHKTINPDIIRKINKKNDFNIEINSAVSYQYIYIEGGIVVVIVIFPIIFT